MDNDRLIAERMVEVMNNALALDQQAVRKLTTHEVSCNRALGEHRGLVMAQRHENLPQVDMTKPGWSAEVMGARTLQIARGEAPAWSISVLGILNGIAGVLPDGYGRIEAVFAVDCPKVSHCEVIAGDVRLKGLVVGDKCPVCGSELILGNLLAFKLSNVTAHGEAPTGAEHIRMGFREVDRLGSLPHPGQEAELVICDGCNVKKIWEHRCHEEAPIMVRGESVDRACECAECRGTTVYVNGARVEIERSELSYAEVLKLAEMLPGPMYSMTYKRAADGKEGIMAPGDTVEIVDGTVFNAILTDRA